MYITERERDLQEILVTLDKENDIIEKSVIPSNTFFKEQH